MTAYYGVKNLIHLPVKVSSIVLVALFSSIIACKHSVAINYEDGLKSTDTYCKHPSQSTSYTKRGKIVYTDSITGRRVKVIKYKTKIGCWEYSQKKRILISYDSAGSRISRKNLLRIENCDTCRRYSRKVRSHW
jgi:hypothetical protein